MLTWVGYKVLKSAYNYFFSFDMSAVNLFYKLWSLFLQEGSYYGSIKIELIHQNHEILKYGLISLIKLQILTDSLKDLALLESKGCLGIYSKSDRSCQDVKHSLSNPTKPCSLNLGHEDWLMLGATDWL